MISTKAIQTVSEHEQTVKKVVPIRLLGRPADGKHAFLRSRPGGVWEATLLATFPTRAAGRRIGVVQVKGLPGNGEVLESTG